MIGKRLLTFGTLTLAVLCTLFSASQPSAGQASSGKAGAGLSSLPADAQGPVSAALGKGDSTYWLHRSAAGFRGENPRQGLVAEFTRQGAEVRIEARTQNLRWGLVTRGYGYGDALHRVKAVAPQVTANRVEYRRDGVTEWYENGPLGLEQGFTLAHRPGKANGQVLTVELTLRGDLSAVLEPDGKGLELRRKNGESTLRYTGLTARDATGRELRSWLEVRGERLLVRVKDEGARYPVLVDPWIQQAELTASDGKAEDFFGSSVAVDGSTAVVGASNRTVGSNQFQGAAYVFVESGGTWSQQAELTSSDGMAGDSFGTSVAISGGTVVVGAPTHTVDPHGGEGAAYVFVESGGTWSQQAELTASDGTQSDYFGSSVTISGRTAMVGNPFHTVGSNAYQGAVYVFVESGGTWSQQPELIASDGLYGDEFGSSVAVDGSTAVVGAFLHTVGSNQFEGAAYVFVESGGTWSQQAELTSSDGMADDSFGTSVAVSGSTAVVGASSRTVGSNQYQGEAYVFVRSGETWSQQAELTSSDGAYEDLFGYSVAVSGSMAVVGALQHTVGSNAYQGAAYVFVESGGTWSQQAELTASDGAAGDWFGSSVTVDSSAVVVGAIYHKVGSNTQQGVAYEFGSGPFYTLSAAPSNVSVPQGGQGTSTITITPANGFSGSVSLSASGLPSGVTAAFNPNPATSSSTLTLTASGTATTGTTTVTVTGTSGSLTQTTTLVLTVTPSPSYTLSASPNSVSVVQGGQETSKITITPLYGFGGSVSLSASGLPSGVTAAFNPNPATSTSTLTLTASGTATTGTTKVTVTGTSGSLTQTTPLTLTVTPAPEVTLSPASLNFGNEAINTTSAAKTVTLKNTGAATLNISGIAASANFGVSSTTCGATLTVGKTCKVSVTFTPTQLGVVTGTISFTDDALNSPQTVSLSGTGIADATVAPASATYAKQVVGTTSAAKTFTLTNNQPVALTSIAISTTGDFAVSATTCGTNLAAKGKCTISVIFKPTATGTRTGQLKVSDSASNSPQTSNLKGTGK